MLCFLVQERRAYKISDSIGNEKQGNTVLSTNRGRQPFVGIGDHTDYQPGNCKGNRRDSPFELHHFHTQQAQEDPECLDAQFPHRIGRRWLCSKESKLPEEVRVEELGQADDEDDDG